MGLERFRTNAPARPVGLGQWYIERSRRTDPFRASRFALR